MTTVYMYGLEQVVPVTLPENLSSHTDRYTLESKRSVSRFAYFKLGEKLSHLGYSPEDITFTPEGKAVLPGIYFSLSHSKCYISIVVSDRECGIDTEEIIPDARLGLSSKILSEEEQKEYSLAGNKNEYLTKKWTLKEAYGKLLGTGITSSVLKVSPEGTTFRIEDSVTSAVPGDDLTVFLNERILNYGKPE